MALPDEGIWITDGGLETTLIFHRGADLPHFAAFDLLKDDEGRELLRSYFGPYREIARRHDVGIVLDSATWRASRDWGERLGYSASALVDANRRAVELVEEMRDSDRVVVNGVIGPRGDGYVAGDLMTPEEAERYHAEQIATFAETTADMVGAITMTYAEEAIGIVRAAAGHGMPVVVSFTVETDGRLPSGQPLGEAVDQVDDATDGAVVYFMVNCAHPTHFDHVLRGAGSWRERIGGIRANASTMSHAELDEAEELDDGDPEQLGAQYRDLLALLPNARVLGGCCGTDHRHVEAICAACTG